MTQRQRDKVDDADCGSTTVFQVHFGLEGATPSVCLFLLFTCRTAQGVCLSALSRSLRSSTCSRGYPNKYEYKTLTNFNGNKFNSPYALQKAP